ncbi:ketol-acid reductoisomerase [Candidatus Carsonella ruddii HT isolate Thao2000]|uniref:Ketol-acid reductoisomerase (NADP(+)) n=1 Tax=Candidatus Carsonella ruddii HT isolate Thao2000 TaxID=1202539 RepID=J3TEI4_CARRU|nr:ketol-acid reductoisomerase [Candidatus Carsonella ruddii]AFP84172.1 ketol-acid reductoisomerase [Candidatus Carsonella ruddii HT isolate Thao2000]
MFYDKDCDKFLLKNKIITVVGYGSQGHAQAQNLKDSDLKVYICLKEGSKKINQAIKDGFEVIQIEKAVLISDIIVILIPDEDQRLFYYNYIDKKIKNNKTIIFSHGFNIHYKQIIPKNELNIILVAPKAPGHTVRSTFCEGSGVPALISIYQDFSKNSLQIALSYAMCIGSGRVGIIPTSFKEETETDLFGEQAVLCGGVSSLIICGFETLVEAGYSPELAYFECLHEMKLIVDLIYEGGIKNMRFSISNTAEYGDYYTMNEFYYSIMKKKMKKVLKNIQNGNFSKNFLLDKQSNFVKLNLFRDYYSNHLIELVGLKIRSLFNWKHKKIIN